MASCIQILLKIPLLTAFLLAMYILFYAKDKGHTDSGIKASDVHTNRQHAAPIKIHLAVVACEGKSKRVLQEAVTMIKSALIFTKSPLHVHIFTNTLTDDFEELLSRWPKKAKDRFTYSIRPVEYPLPPKEREEFINWWGRCASFRLFLPEVLDQVDSIIYVDTDVLFLIPVDRLWEYFWQFDNRHVGALAPRVGWEFKVPSSNPNFIVKPDGTVTQVNSGVFLMNLTRMRESRFHTDSKISLNKLSWSRDLLLPLYRANKKDMYGDQNLINVVFHYNPDLLFYLPCKLNYHHKFCFDNEPDRMCKSAEMEGAAIIHGSADTFYNNYAPAFGAVNNAMRQYNFEDDLDVYLLRPMLRGLRQPEVDQHDHCGGRTHLFTLELRKRSGNRLPSQ